MRVGGGVTGGVTVRAGDGGTGVLVGRGVCIRLTFTLVVVTGEPVAGGGQEEVGQRLQLPLRGFCQSKANSNKMPKHTNRF